VRLGPLRRRWQRQVRRLRQRYAANSEDGRFAPGQFLDVAYAGTSEKDKWLEWLQNAASNHSNVVADLKVDPMYDPLRGDPRFHELLRRVGLDSVAIR